MPHPSKAKGDRYERAALSFLVEQAPDLVRSMPQRMLGAGRKDDVGDLAVFDDVAIQVRALAAMGQAIRTSARDAVRQAANGEKPLALGLVPIIGARGTKVKWLACAAQWPEEFPVLADFKQVGRLVAFCCDDNQGARRRRVARIADLDSMIHVGPVEAWLDSYRLYRQPVLV